MSKFDIELFESMSYELAKQSIENFNEEVGKMIDSIDRQTLNFREYNSKVILPVIGKAIEQNQAFTVTLIRETLLKLNEGQD